MDDLIKRLRVNAALCEPEYENDFLKAADALERQREALECIARSGAKDIPAMEIARQALGDTQ